MKSKKHIKINASDVRSIIKDLSLIVVSMDRIGSTIGNNRRKLALETCEFFQKAKIFKLLSRARAILSVAYDNQSTKIDVSSLEEEAERLSYWKPKINHRVNRIS